MKTTGTQNMLTIITRQEKVNELVTCLDNLEKTGMALRDALLARRSDAIWGALELQERTLLRLEQIRRELGIKEGSPLDESLFPSERRESMRKSAARTRILQRLNQSLIRVFLDLIEKTLKSINAHSGQLPLTYAADGTFGRATGPLFVHQTG